MPTKPDDVLPHPTSFDSTERLAQINPDELTPKQALDALYELKALCR